MEKSPRKTLLPSVPRRNVLEGLGPNLRHWTPVSVLSSLLFGPFFGCLSWFSLLLVLFCFSYLIGVLFVLFSVSLSWFVCYSVLSLRVCLDFSFIRTFLFLLFDSYIICTSFLCLHFPVIRIFLCVFVLISLLFVSFFVFTFLLFTLFLCFDFLFIHNFLCGSVLNPFYLNLSSCLSRFLYYSLLSFRLC